MTTELSTCHQLRTASGHMMFLPYGHTHVVSEADGRCTLVSRTGKTKVVGWRTVARLARERRDAQHAAHLVESLIGAA